jgi:mannosyl-3-phosphoglycerate phosphatase
MFRKSRAIVVFSHVDDVLHDLQAPAVARAATILRDLDADDTALILCSSKTRAEIELVQQKLQISHPFVSENGGAVYIPSGYFGVDPPNSRAVAGYQAVEFGRPYPVVVELLHRAAERLRLGVVGFSDMSIEEVAQECRLPLLQARLAKLREYDEPFRLPDATAAARARLFKALSAVNLRCTEGRSFDRVGAPVDVELGASSLIGLYRRAGHAIVTAGFAHATAHDTLLALVDYPVMVPEDDGGAAISVIDWAEAIVDTVRALRRRINTIEANSVAGSSASRLR